MMFDKRNENERVKKGGFLLKGVFTFLICFICIYSGIPAAPASAVSEVSSHNAIESYNFDVKIGNSEAGNIISVAGLSIGITISKLRNDRNSIMELSPDHVEFGHITLKRRFSTNSIFNNWIEGMVEGNIEHFRKNVIITLLGYSSRNEDYYTIQRWRLYGCLPVSWQLSPLTIDNADELTEQLRVACEWLEEESDL